MADFATEYDLLLAKPTFKIIVAGITGATPSTVVGVITDDIQIAGTNTFYNTLQSQAVAGLQETLAKFSSVGEKIAAAMGKEGFGPASVRTIEQGLDFWTSSERPKFSQSMIFVAQKASDDVRLPVASLYKTVFPKLNGFGFTDTVSPPLDYVPYSATSSEKVRGTLAISIGNWFKATGMIMNSVSFKFSKECTTAGNPLFAAGSISFQPFREVSWQEVCAYMGLSVKG